MVWGRTEVDTYSHTPWRQEIVHRNTTVIYEQHSSFVK